MCFALACKGFLQQALSDPLIRAVIITTPPATHGEFARQCFERGKHVLLEKPLDISVARASATFALARSSGLRLGVVLQHRFRRGSQALASELALGRLGRLQAAFVRVPWWRPQSYYDQPGRGTIARDGGGVLMTQAIHTLDLFRSLVGVRRVVSAQVIKTNLHQMETEDLASATFELSRWTRVCRGVARWVASPRATQASLTVTSCWWIGRLRRVRFRW